MTLINVSAADIVCRLALIISPDMNGQQLNPEYANVIFALIALKLDNYQLVPNLVQPKQHCLETWIN
jgi:hypothetical protein